jgi:hypothetical protein
MVGADLAQDQALVTLQARHELTQPRAVLVRQLAIVSPDIPPNEH